MANERMTADDRTAQLVQAGYTIARTKGIKKVTRAAVARETGVSVTLINRYLDGREGLRGAVLARAVELKDAATLAAAGEFYELPVGSMPRALEREVRNLSR